MIIARRTSAIDQSVSDAAQMRTPTPLTPADIQRRVLRICQDYDRIENAKKKNVRIEPLAPSSRSERTKEISPDLDQLIASFYN